MVATQRENFEVMENKTYNELRKECKAKGLSCRGKKVELIARLKEHVGGEEEKTSVSSSLKNAASVFANLLVAEKEKAVVKEKAKKRMMATHLDSGLDLTPYLDCGTSQLLAPSLLSDKVSELTSQHKDALPEKPVTLKNTGSDTTKIMNNGLKSLRNGYAAERKSSRPWWHIEEQEMTDELKRDVEMLRMRHHLDTKRFYTVESKDKKLKGPKLKNFHVGTIIAGAFEPKSQTLRKKDRGQNFVDEMLSDSVQRRKIRHRFATLQRKSEASGRSTKRRRRN